MKARIAVQTHTVPVGHSVLAGNQVAIVVPIPVQSTMEAKVINGGRLY